MNNQRFNDYVTDLCQYASKCEFGDSCNSLIKYILIFGLKVFRLTECLHREPGLTLRMATQVGQAAKETKKQAKKLTTSETPEIEVYVHKTDRKKTWNTVSD